ncbi:MAG: biotin transporter BioY [Gemmatimonadetes bacterium]|nr:biotin transporter BioY [Gemmatimonadota bacterium]MDA1104272.1 biotin transporter BioY [Gemmatimonadota bacterium]
MNTFAESVRSWALQEVVEDRRARYSIGVVAFALATAFGAQVAVVLPWTPVPVTLQPLFVILAGVVLGPRMGALAIAAYVTVGALGAPVFANGGAGLPWLLGPTGGYLLAAPAAAFVAGVVAGREGAALRTIAGLTLGVATMYVGGVSQLLAVTGLGLGEVLALGVVPFLVGDVTKILLAFFVVKSTRRTSLGRA